VYRSKVLFVQDAFGTRLLDALDHPEIHGELVERDDGFIDVVRMDYFAPLRRWPASERQGLRFVRGRILDVGCGAGRVSLVLQERGYEVVAIDPSPGAVAASRRRGVRDVRQMRFEDVDASLGHFGTMVLYGNNFGLFGSRAKARRLLKRMRPLSDRIVASSVDPYGTSDPVHLAYHERNRRRQRMGGQLRLRVRYRDLADPWFDYLLAAPSEMEELVDGTGWSIDRFVVGGSLYVAVLR
jgi:SAM-dependent methyltransferase